MPSDAIEYNVRVAAAADARFIIETTARVRQPRSLTWNEWEPYGIQWARFNFFIPFGLMSHGETLVVESNGIVLAFIMLLNEYSARVVEMLYVKKDFRGLGLGRLLLDAAGFDDEIPCRAPTDSLKMWAKRRGLKLTAVD